MRPRIDNVDLLSTKPTNRHMYLLKTLFQQRRIMTINTNLLKTCPPFSPERHFLHLKTFGYAR